jgi:3-phenylpropionate/cinnamic acid dioxygenase small subunit
VTADRDAIENLLARYCELFDSGDLDGYVALFEGGTVSNQVETSNGPGELRAFFERTGLFYDGVPHTRHLTTNIYVEIAPDGQSAISRSYVTILQALDDFPLQPVFVGQYQDELVKRDGEWRFASRNCEPFLAGDLSRHARQYPPPGPVVVMPQISVGRPVTADDVRSLDDDG